MSAGCHAAGSDAGAGEGARPSTRANGGPGRWAHDDTSRDGLRLGLAGCGIDVFTTSANAGWPLEVVAAEGEPYHRYALILVEQAHGL